LQSACDKSDADVEPHPLWEYPCVAVGQPQRLLTFDLTKPLPTERLQSVLKIRVEDRDNELNGNV
jgi:hypothetical protein